jgi:hypothetical protein
MNKVVYIGNENGNETKQCVKYLSTAVHYKVQHLYHCVACVNNCIHTTSYIMYSVHCTIGFS